MIKYLKMDDQKCVGCMSCATACSLAYAKEDNPAKSRIQVLGLGSGHFHLVACDQECRLCVAECPMQAITVTKQGVVMIDKKLCVGCLACVAVCPTEAMRFYPARVHALQVRGLRRLRQELPQGRARDRREGRQPRVAASRSRRRPPPDATEEGVK